MMEARPVKFSQTRLTELMTPSYANFGGKVHGGLILSLMDKVAYACASKHAGTYCVTVTVDNVEFLEPVEVGELLHLDASVNYVGNTSLVVGISVTSENIKTNSVKHTNSSYFTMVAKDDAGNPAQVPELVLENMTEMRRFVEAIKRNKIKKEHKERMKKHKADFIMVDEMSLLEGQRCQFRFLDEEE